MLFQVQYLKNIRPHRGTAPNSCPNGRVYFTCMTLYRVESHQNIFTYVKMAVNFELDLSTKCCGGSWLHPYNEMKSIPANYTLRSKSSSLGTCKR